jgi:hypothetical protein
LASRQEEIHDKGFDMFGRVQYSLEDEVPTENNAVRIGVKKLEDAVVNIGSFKKAHR